MHSPFLCWVLSGARLASAGPGRGLCLSVILEIEYFVRRNIDTTENVSCHLLPSITCRLINRTHGLKEASNFPFSFSRYQNQIASSNNARTFRQFLTLWLRTGGKITASESFTIHLSNSHRLLGPKVPVKVITLTFYYSKC